MIQVEIKGKSIRSRTAPADLILKLCGYGLKVNIPTHYELAQFRSLAR